MDNIRPVKSVKQLESTMTISYPNNCPRCGNVAEAWTEDGVSIRIRCRMCGYDGLLPHPDLRNGAWRVG